MNYPDVMTKGEAAGYSRFSERTINRWVARGWLLCFRLPNGQLRFKKADVQKAMDRQWSEDSSPEPESDIG